MFLGYLRLAPGDFIIARDMWGDGDEIHDVVQAFIAPRYVHTRNPGLSEADQVLDVSNILNEAWMEIVDTCYRNNLAPWVRVYYAQARKGSVPNAPAESWEEAFETYKEELLELSNDWVEAEMGKEGADLSRLELFIERLEFWVARSSNNGIQLLRDMEDATPIYCP